MMIFVQKSMRPKIEIFLMAKKETSFFVLRSTFSNFAIRDGELTPSRHKKD